LALVGCGDASTGTGLGGGDPSGGGGVAQGPTGNGGGSGSTAGGSGTNAGTGTGNGATGGGTGGTTGGGTGGTTGGGTTGGGTGTGGGTQTTPPSFAVALDKSTAETELRDLTNLTVTVTPKDGFTGTVELAATGLPTGATAKFTPSSVSVTSASSVTATLSIDTPSDVVPTDAAASVQVTGSQGTITANAPLAFSVKPQLTITIPQNIANMAPSNDSYGASPILIKAPSISSSKPVAILFKNADTSAAHTIHAGGANGFFHGKSAIPSGGMDQVRNVTATGTYGFYLHGETGGDGHTGSVKITN